MKISLRGHATREAGFRILGGDAPTLRAPPPLAALEQLGSSDVDAPLTLEAASARLEAYLETMRKEESRMVAAALAYAPGMDQKTNMARQWRQMRDMWIRANHDIMSYLPRLCVADQLTIMARLSSFAEEHRRWTIDGPALEIGQMPTIALHK